MPIILITLILIALSIGSTKINVIGAIKAAVNNNHSDISFRILFHLRMPRVIASIMAGAALAVAGAAIQAVLNNPLASTSIIGVNSGAGLFVIIFIALSPAAYIYLPLIAFAGAFCACFIICLIAFGSDSSKISITLIGIAISSILNSAISDVKTFFPDTMYDSNAFMVGGFSGVTFNKVIPASVIILVSIILFFLFAKNADILTLGEEKASTLGLNVKATRFLFITLACFLAGSAVSFSGLISFVGLVVPHICRKLVGCKHTLLFPSCALGGAILVILCDIISRVVFSPYEIPVGIILSFIGGPFFIILILFKKRKSHYA